MVYSTDEQIICDLTVRFGYTRRYRISKKAQGHYKALWSNIFYADNARFFKERGLRADKDKMRWEDFDVNPYPFLRGLIDSDGTFSKRSDKNRFPLNNVTFLCPDGMFSGLQRFLLKKDFHAENTLNRV